MTFSCIICYESFVSDSVVSVTNCGHIYHRDCLIEWLLRENKCPICNSRNPNHRDVFPTFLSSASTENTNENQSENHSEIIIVGMSAAESLTQGTGEDNNSEDTMEPTMESNELNLAIIMSLQERNNELETALAVARLNLDI